MTTPDPGWHPDPSGRHEYRWWDGMAWSDDVADRGVPSVDPMVEASAPYPADDPGATAPYGQPYPPYDDAAPTAPLDPTQAYGQPPPGDWPPAAPEAVPPGGQQWPGDQQWSGAQQWSGDTGGQPYGTGGYPPGEPRRTGPPTGLIVAGAVVVVLLLVGLAAAVTRGGDGEAETSGDDTDDTTADTTDDTGGATTTSEAPTTTADTSPDPQTTTVFDLEVGDCVTDDAEVAGEVQDVTIIDCSEPHTLEVFHSHDIGAASLPDATGIDTLVREQCLPAFEQFVGLDLGSSSLEVHYFSPTSDSWEAGDRELLCLVTDPAGDVTGSLEGANR